MESSDMDVDKTGTNWADDEVAVLVASYFEMLSLDLTGQSYNKSEYRRRVIASIGRSNGSVEFKLQNVSAVLDEIGLPWIRGLKPRGHYQDSLVAVVEQHLVQHSRLFEKDLQETRVVPHETAIMVEPPTNLGGSEADRPEALRRLIGKFDPAARDARNRALGRAGEEFVLGFERRRLERAGCDDLAAKVRWVAHLDGDGFGYDIRSFDTDGQDRFLEVKTTCGNERTPFWITRRECEVAAQQEASYRIRRVFHFRNDIRMFDITPPLEKQLSLTPTKFRAEPK